jgi:hypothetical protein
MGLSGQQWGALGGLGLTAGLIPMLTGGSGTTDAYTKQLQSLISSLSGAGASATKSGEASLAPVLDYLKKAVGGDPSTLLSATGASAGRVIDQYDAARKSITAGSPRGGGTTGALAASHTQEAAQLADLLSQARTGAASTLGSLGSGLLSAGFQGQSAAISGLDALISTLSQQQQGQDQMWGGLLGGIGEALIGLL